MALARDLAAAQRALCHGSVLLAMLFGQLPGVLVGWAGAPGRGRQAWGCQMDLLGLCSGTGLLWRAGEAPCVCGQSQWGCGRSCWDVPRQRFGGAERWVVMASSGRSSEEAVGAGRGRVRSSVFGGRCQGGEMCCVRQVRGARPAPRQEQGDSSWALLSAAQLLKTRVWAEPAPGLLLLSELSGAAVEKRVTSSVLCFVEEAAVQRREGACHSPVTELSEQVCRGVPFSVCADELDFLKCHFPKMQRFSVLA